MIGFEGETDLQFFAMHPDRTARIREPRLFEAVSEFDALGPHDRDRRRMIIVKVPDGPHKGMLMPIPFLLFADETVENTDKVLLPIVREIMENARGEPH
jgi:hypothetical protein